MTHLRITISLVALRLAVTMAVAQTASPTPAAESPKREKIVVRIIGDNGLTWRGNNLVYLSVFDIGGKSVKTVAEFKEALLGLSPGTEVIWDSGCLIFEELPVSGPKTTIKVLQEFSSAHGVTFTYRVSGY